MIGLTLLDFSTAEADMNLHQLEITQQNDDQLSISLGLIDMDTFLSGEVLEKIQADLPSSLMQAITTTVMK